MTVPPFSSDSAAIEAAEAQLQAELQAMFAVDTQQHLQAYATLVQQLSAETWREDIQDIYRAVHTIKGGAVTVEADAMLQTAMVLEDLLSDLRYQDPAPPLADGHLIQMLMEAGELLGSSLEITDGGEAAIAQVQPTVERVKTLHELIRQRYLPNWSELSQVHQEFAEQGFDLVVLELEMALSSLTASAPIPQEAQATAHQTLAHLRSIGQDLQLASGWTALIARSESLLGASQGAPWQQQWPIYLQVLKDCAKGGGHLTPALESALPPEYVPEIASPSEGISLPTLERPDPMALELELADLAIPAADEDWMPGLSAELDTEMASSFDFNLEPDFSLDLDALAISPDLDSTPSFLDAFGLADLNLEMNHPQTHLNGAEEMEASALASLSEGLTRDFDFDLPATLAQDLTSAPEELTLPESRSLPESLAAPSSTPMDAEMGLFPHQSEAAEPLLPAPSQSMPKSSEKAGVQIPVPLARLDQSSQRMVAALLTARSALTLSRTLQAHMAQMTTLTRESAQSITHLRQLQDDYALLRSLSDEQEAPNGLTLERYRQGYATINRLLENILRMSELGSELEGMTQQAVHGFSQLDRDIIRLKDGIESSRLVPFRNLSLRARAIVRDLTNRYGKPAQLVVEGEQVELDAGVVQQLEPALLHLLRNAYDHGLEAVDERLNQGKPVQGLVHLSVQRRGNLYRLSLQDDGRGIDAETVQRLAEAGGFPLTQTSTPANLLAVLCQPGFSSRAAVSEVSGRGVGMDVVAAQIARMGGRLSLTTQPGRGTTFQIEIPAPQLLVPCILLQVNDRTVAVPTEDIQETVLLSSVQVKRNNASATACSWTVTTERGTAPGFELLSYWQPGDHLWPETAIGLRTRVGGADYWLIADDLLEQAELLIQPLPSPLVPPAGMMGVSLQADGRLISVLDPEALVQVIQQTPALTHRPDEPESAVGSNTITILVVDDAALMRRRLESSLNTYGFTTHACQDGAEAWQWLQSNRMPDLVITDVEMPNMDGFTLIDRCRQAQFTMPILVVSSRLSEEWGHEAKRLGANDYLNKGFSTAELIQRVQQYCAPEPVPLGTEA
ncbi:response regulator [Synechococcales cyanobacterium C]|uniref:histidine kinase n=1 Tax=Petrachloros mirabilis ULC683 TaxID=2781853 RepID=A0A8K2A6N3_9CYAN|nr:response regulator [Petrachloros mirabilis]NCJ06199.1 response regulator [Petrachloros mirabilis ULC683]